MANEISVSTEELQATITAYKASREKKMNAIEAMNNAIKALDKSWDGKASQEMLATFDKLYKALKQSDSIMQDAINELTATQALFVINEAEILSTMTKLDTGSESEFSK